MQAVQYICDKAIPDEPMKEAWQMKGYKHVLQASAAQLLLQAASKQCRSYALDGQSAAVGAPSLLAH